MALGVVATEARVGVPINGPVRLDIVDRRAVGVEILAVLLARRLRSLGESISCRNRSDRQHHSGHGADFPSDKQRASSGKTRFWNPSHPRKKHPLTAKSQREAETSRWLMASDARYCGSVNTVS